MAAQAASTMAGAGRRDRPGTPCRSPSKKSTNRLVSIGSVADQTHAMDSEASGGTMIRTGAQYRDSIRDSRQVYIGGERVKDVTTHPMFKPLVDIRARFYDMQHEPATRDLMGCRDGNETHAIANKPPRTQEPPTA